MLHAEDLLGGSHLVAAHLGEVAQDVHVVLEPGVEHVAALAAGARHDEHLVALVDVARHRRGALAGLVVRVRVDAHEPEPVGHVEDPSVQRSRGVPENGRRPSSHPARPPDHRTPAPTEDPYAVAPPRSRHHPMVGGRRRSAASPRSASSCGGAFGTTSGSVRPEVTGYRGASRTPRSSSSTTCTGPEGVAVRLPDQRAGRQAQPGRHGRGRRARAGSDVGAPGGADAHERAGRDRASSTRAPGCRRPPPEPTRRRRAAPGLPPRPHRWWRSGPGLVD